MCGWARRIGADLLLKSKQHTHDQIVRLLHDLAPNKKIRVSTTWTAPDDTDVEWTATVMIDDEVVAEATASTEVSVKSGKNNNNGNN
jgi:hypothetical protein